MWCLVGDTDGSALPSFRCIQNKRDGMYLLSSTEIPFFSAKHVPVVPVNIYMPIPARVQKGTRG